jgi:hypothetical protein
MICDLNREFDGLDVCGHLTHGLSESSKKKYVNKRRYGNRTWYDAKIYKFSMFNESKTKAITAYLEYKLLSDELSKSDKRDIKQALECYWYKRI